jgi:hypothetical protein
VLSNRGSKALLSCRGHRPVTAGANAIPITLSQSYPPCFWVPAGGCRGRACAGWLVAPTGWFKAHPEYIRRWCSNGFLPFMISLHPLILFISTIGDDFIFSTPPWLASQDGTMQDGVISSTCNHTNYRVMHLMQIIESCTNHTDGFFNDCNHPFSFRWLLLPAKKTFSKGEQNERSEKNFLRKNKINSLFFCIHIQNHINHIQCSHVVWGPNRLVLFILEGSPITRSFQIFHHKYIIKASVSLSPNHVGVHARKMAF